MMPVNFPDCPDCGGMNQVRDSDNSLRLCLRCEKRRRWPAHLGELVNPIYQCLKSTPLSVEYPVQRALIIEYDEPTTLKQHIKTFLKKQRDPFGLPLLERSWKELIPASVMAESINSGDEILSQYKLLIINICGGGNGFPAYDKASSRHCSIISARLGVDGLVTWVAIQGGLGTMMSKSYISTDLKNALKMVEGKRSIRISIQNTASLAPVIKLKSIGHGLAGVDTTLLKNSIVSKK